MRITFRLIIALVVTVSTVAGFSAFFQVRQERQRLLEDQDRRARLLAEGLQESVSSLVERKSLDRLQRFVERFGKQEKLAGLAVYDLQKKPLAVASRWVSYSQVASRFVDDAAAKGQESSGFDSQDGFTSHVYAVPLTSDAGPQGTMTIFHDASYIASQLGGIWRRTFGRVLVQTILIAIVTLLIVRWSVVGPVDKMAEWMQRLRAGDLLDMGHFPKEDIFAPIAKEVTTFARHLSQAKQAATEEARLRQSAESLWTAQRLKEYIKVKLQNRTIFVISNREPYMHLRRGRKLEWIVPAGGLVTALDPVLRASGGTWIAHGAGDADWEVVDDKGRLRVPPNESLYNLRRVALSKEEENGYYYGFSSEGLWPLCHIAHTRPTFRAEDWQQYQAVNRKFAAAALEEMEGIEEPYVLVQDSHFALLPRFIKEKRPDARVALFWHIPWPNPEAFGICPWQRDLLSGMLGADLIGFHIQSHCNNFLDTVDGAMESRIDWERFAVAKNRHTTFVRPFPISVAFPEPGTEEISPGPDRTALLKDVNIKAEFLAVGVERMDYTKGVLERFKAVERFLEKYPQYQGRFVLAQLGAPSRTHIKRYQDFLAEVESEAERINWKFKAKEYRPIVFLKKHHSHEEIIPFYKHADICLVTSLHDGMNLVAKEFVAARSDNGGVLILSRFTGAARELRDALIVNPYNIDQMADAIKRALEMTSTEKRSRMGRMREIVRENNIYQWAGNLIEELARIRLPINSNAKV